MGHYTEEWGWVEDDEPALPEKPALWVPKKVQPVAPKHAHPEPKQAQASTSKHPSPGTPAGRVKGGKAVAQQLGEEGCRKRASHAAKMRWKHAQNQKT